MAHFVKICYSKVLRFKPELFGFSIFRSVSDFKKHSLPVTGLNPQPLNFKEAV